MFNDQGPKKESLGLNLSLKDDIFKHLVVSTKWSSTWNIYWSFWALIKL